MISLIFRPAALCWWAQKQIIIIIIIIKIIIIIIIIIIILIIIIIIIATTTIIIALINVYAEFKFKDIHTTTSEPLYSRKPVSVFIICVDSVKTDVVVKTCMTSQQQP